MKLVSINDDLNYDKIYKFCQLAASDESPVANNMSVIDWKNNPASLLHTIYIQNRFNRINKADYFFLEHEDQYVAGSGFYPLDYDNNISILGVRTYTLIDYRSKLLHGNLILPKQKEDSEKLHYKSLIMTFNEYNLWLLKCIEQLSSGRGKIISNKIPEFYKNWKKLEFKIQVKYTEQWCCYQHIDPDYNQNFFKIVNDIRVR
jgi:hypothetical protein